MRLSPPHAGDLTHLVGRRGALVANSRPGEGEERRLERLRAGLLLQLRGRARGDEAPVVDHAVRSPSRLGSWNTTPKRLRTSIGRAVTSSPSSSSEPVVGRNRVVSILIVVVFPAPFGPRNAKISPGRTSKETSFTAMTLPNDLTMCWTRMIGRSLTYALGAAGLAA